LLIFGLQWLRKAILRASGLKEIHDEVAIFAREAAEARARPPVDPRAFDAYAFTLSFKGVFLEGLEVAFIVLAPPKAASRWRCWVPLRRCLWLLPSGSLHAPRWPGFRRTP
jgi:uncharacterized membrane protein